MLRPAIFIKKIGCYYVVYEYLYVSKRWMGTAYDKYPRAKEHFVYLRDNKILSRATIEFTEPEINYTFLTAY
jgi:hypothetical protein